MRKVRNITSEEENFRLEPFVSTGSVHCSIIRRDPVEPEPVGTIILMPMQVVWYDKDCDGSLMARLRFVNQWDLESIEDGVTDPDDFVLNRWGLYPGTELVVTPDELRMLIAQAETEEQ